MEGAESILEEGSYLGVKLTSGEETWWLETGDQKWHCTKGIVERTVTMTMRAVKKDALGLATKRTEKLMEEKL